MSSSSARTGGQVHERVNGDEETSIHLAPAGKIEL